MTKNNINNSSNPCGLTGFILGVCSIILCWVPYLNILLIILGITFSSIGLKKQPRKLAIAGLILSGITLTLFILIIIFILLISTQYAGGMYAAGGR